jgi:hypothetical protein
MRATYSLIFKPTRNHRDGIEYCAAETNQLVIRAHSLYSKPVIATRGAQPGQLPQSGKFLAANIFAVRLRQIENLIRNAKFAI